MKTKTKMIALVEIVVVLCSVFLVAIPAIAAEQKVSAGAVTTASEDDYVLEIYGNANEDDTIDMGDVVYTKLAIFGKKPKTELCDAKYDGRINVLDVIQTKLIILGKEKEITVIDSADRIVTVKKPPKRIVVYTQVLEILRTIKVEKDRIAGVESEISSRYTTFYPEYQDIPGLGGLLSSIDCEAILNVEPDVVILSPSSKNKAAMDVLESAGIAVLCLRWYGGRLSTGVSGITDKAVSMQIKELGYVFDKRSEAEEYIDWYESLLNSIKERVEKIPEEAKPKVYFEHTRYKAVDEGRACIKSAGGVNIYPDIPSLVSVDPEEIIEKNPEIIVRTAWNLGGYDLDADVTAGLKEVRDEIMSRPELENVEAVKTGKVYLITGHIQNYGPYSGCRAIFQVIYMAKWFHPELFEDLDPKALHQEYLTRFCGLDIDLDKKGVFVYPEPS